MRPVCQDPSCSGYGLELGGEGICVHAEPAETVLIVDDGERGFSFETVAGDGYGAPTLDEAKTLARTLGLDFEIEQ